jgi:aspartate/methionine/tyrosine aminotransferase
MWQKEEVAEMQIAQRMALLSSESAFEMGQRARQLAATGRDVIYLQIGEPDFATPSHIIEAGVAALRNNATHYVPPAGLPELRQSIANQLGQTYHTTVTSAEVVVVPGAKPVVFYTIMMLVGSGDEVIVPDPGFPAYASVSRFAGATPVRLALHESRNFRFSLDELRAKITPRTRLLILNSPHNPTGAMLTYEDLAAVADLAVKHNFWILSDEIYSRIIYDKAQPHVSMLQFPQVRDHLVLLDGFSKSHAMTGWRLGYGVMPPSVAAQMELFVINSNSCTASFTQLAGIAALEGPQEAVEAMVAEFKTRRDLMVAGLNAIKGVTCANPPGAFYVFPNVSSFGLSSKAVADYLLQEAGVACLNGASFGVAGEGYLRISYANSRSNLEQALVRIEQALAKL